MANTTANIADAVRNAARFTTPDGDVISSEELFDLSLEDIQKMGMEVEAERSKYTGGSNSAFAPKTKRIPKEVEAKYNALLYVQGVKEEESEKEKEKIRLAKENDMLEKLEQQAYLKALEKATPEQIAEMRKKNAERLAELND